MIEEYQRKNPNYVRHHSPSPMVLNCSSVIIFVAIETYARA